MISRSLKLGTIEEAEFDMLMGQEINPLERIGEMHGCTYREAFFIYKGKMIPQFTIQQKNLEEWIR